MSHRNLEVVYEGWLTKSPPSKPIWRARWRRRWFVLRHSGELPGQFYLEYYTDRNCRKLKGKIDLDQCEQVDAGLTFQNNKQKYQHMFDVKTKKRVYYLAAESEEDMNKWVECVCHVCGLKAYKDETEDIDYSPALTEDGEPPQSVAESPPVSPASTISGPYIPISECISGKPLTNVDCSEQTPICNGLGGEFYDRPRKLRLPPNLVIKASSTGTPPLHSPTTDGESVFTDDEWTAPVVKWNTLPTDGLSESDSCRVAKTFARLTVVDGAAPPRPPKPPHLAEPSPPAHGPEETYDFPRSHPPPNVRNCYSNAAPGNGSGNFFRYDFQSGELPMGTSMEPASPHSEGSSSVYSNLPSPLTGPAVNRGLKPGRKASDSTSINSEPSPGGPRVTTLPPPNIDRKLKPRRTASEQGTLPHDGTRKNRAAPSPIPLSLPWTERSSDDEQVYFYQNNGMQFTPAMPKSFEGIQYLDLDLESGSTAQSPGVTPTSPSATVYKTVDFLKTEAFNRTRQEVEEGRKQCASE